MFNPLTIWWLVGDVLASANWSKVSPRRTLSPSNTFTSIFGLLFYVLPVEPDWKESIRLASCTLRHLHFFYFKPRVSHFLCLPSAVGSLAIQIMPAPITFRNVCVFRAHYRLPMILNTAHYKRLCELKDGNNWSTKRKAQTNKAKNSSLSGSVVHRKSISYRTVGTNG